MFPYLQAEKTLAEIIPANGGVVVFDNVLADSENGISYNDTTGVFSVENDGVYVVNWFVAQQTGLAADGSNFALVGASEDWADNEVIASAHVKISQTSGFAVIEFTDLKEPATFKLVNNSGFSAALSERTQVKAGLMVFGLADSEPPPPPSVQLGYIHAQLSEAGAINLPPLGDADSVVFDDVLSFDPYGIISYDDTTGVFTVDSSGTYLVNWQIPVSATNINDYVYMSLVVDGMDYSVCHMPLPIGVLSGSAMVAITLSDTNPSATLQLVNSSGDLVEITDLCNIVITQISAT